MLFAAPGFSDLIPVIVFGAVVFAIWTVLTMISERNRRSLDRLARHSRPASLAEIEERRLARKEDRFQGMQEMAKAVSQPMMPHSELEQSALRVKLANAGFRHESAPAISSGIRVSVLALSFLVALPIALRQEDMIGKLKYLVLITGVGFYLPAIGLWWIRKQRQQAIFLTLPDALDLLVVCVESGLGLDAAMRKVCDEMKGHAKVICEELSLANFQLQMGRPRREVLHDLGVRTGVDDVRALAAILIQADRFGASIAQALRVQSDSMRTRRKQLAEEKAAKTAVQLIFPLVLFIFPGIFVVLVGPAAISIINTMMKK